jgi:hypothetical protein
MKSAGHRSLIGAAALTLLLSPAATLCAAEAKAAPARPAVAAAVAPAETAETEAVASDLPYSTIVARNMFGLVPIPPPPPPDQGPPPDPPPKITPNGIMTIFGKKQALFKVADKPKPGQPQKDTSHVLSEGEREDDIEVVKIDSENNTITFNNHGEVQELVVVDAGATGGAPGGGGGPGAAGPGPGGPMRSGGPMARGHLGPRGGMNMEAPGFNNNIGNPQPSAAPTSGSTFQAPAQSQQNIEDQVMSAARQMAEIEQNRIATQEAVNQGLMPPLPPTLLTPPDATGQGGSPLIISPESVIKK